MEGGSRLGTAIMGGKVGVGIPESAEPLDVPAVLVVGVGQGRI